LGACGGIWRDGNLPLQGYPTLSQFSVGVVYMLCHFVWRYLFYKADKRKFCNTGHRIPEVEPSDA
jgi:hypothetical protein